MKKSENLKYQGKRQSDIAYEKIRDEIISCKLAPSQEISEAWLTSTYSLQKAAVRAALSRLEQEGLVKAIARRGYRIAPVTLKDILEIFEIRMLLEPAVARLAAGRVDEERLVAADDRWREICAQESEPRECAYSAEGINFLLANKEFHLEIALATGNARLVKILAHVLEETDRLICLGLPMAMKTQEVQHGHKLLIKALVRGDAVEAEKAAMKHVEKAKSIIVDAAISSVSLLSTEIEIQTENQKKVG
jgi:DNA-binding GntR family transcriptional regulator